MYTCWYTKYGYMSLQQSTQLNMCYVQIHVHLYVQQSTTKYTKFTFKNVLCTDPCISVDTTKYTIKNV